MKLFDTTFKKSIFIFIIVFLLVAVGGFCAINYLHGVITDNHIHSEFFIVQDKISDDGQFYIISDSNETYLVRGHDIMHDKKVFKTVIIGHEYKFIVREPTTTDEVKHILQVYNDTSDT